VGDAVNSGNTGQAWRAMADEEFRAALCRSASPFQQGRQCGRVETLQAAEIDLHLTGSNRIAAFAHRGNVDKRELGWSDGHWQRNYLSAGRGGLAASRLLRSASVRIRPSMPPLEISDAKLPL